MTDALSCIFAWLDPGLAAAIRDGRFTADRGTVWWCLLGARDLVEGSTLGSRLSLYQRESIDCQFLGALDYWGYQVDESAAWQAFRRALNDQLGSSAERQVAVAAARSVFRRSIAAFDTLKRREAVSEGH